MFRLIRKIVRLVKGGCKSIVRHGFKTTVIKIINLRTRESDFLIKAKGFHLIEENILEGQRKTEFLNNIKFSILTPLYNTPRDYLDEMISSVQNQTYDNWEICLADGSDLSHTYVGEICIEKAREDSRIKYLRLEKNEGISQNTNACISIAKGDYYGLLDHDDVLHVSALYEMAKRINETNADFLYSDEAKFSDEVEDAKSFTFKSGFGKDELRAHNYICHFTVFSKALLEDGKELYRKNMDGSQDHDMVLRLTESADRVEHISKILYYWRLHKDSVSMGVKAKPYAVDAAIRAVRQQLERADELGKVESNLPYLTLYRVRYIIQDTPIVTIIIYNMVSEKVLKRCIESIVKKTTYKYVELVVINDTNIKLNISGKLKNTFLSIKTVEIDASKTRGMKWNKGLDIAKGEYVVLLDAGIHSESADWIQEMLMFAQRKDVFAVGGKVCYRDGVISSGGIAIDSKRKSRIKMLCRGMDKENPGYEAMLIHQRNATVIWGACTMFNKGKIELLGKFNPNLVGYEDVDICLKGIKKGYWNVWTNFATFLDCRKKVVDEYEDCDIGGLKKIWGEDVEKDDKYYNSFLRELNVV